MKFPNLHWRVSHGAGAFPDISDRFLLGFRKDAEEARTYATRFWWVGDVPFREFDALDKVLPAEWQHLLRWPREIVEQHRHASIAS